MIAVARFTDPANSGYRTPPEGDRHSQHIDADAKAEAITATVDALRRDARWFAEHGMDAADIVIEAWGMADNARSEAAAATCAFFDEADGPLTPDDLGTVEAIRDAAMVEFGAMMAVAA